MSPHEPYNLSKVLVLVVDDDADASELLATVLGYCGALVVRAGSAQEAMTALTTVQPDVIVSDINMPALDGFWLIRELRRVGCWAATIAVSADTNLRTRALLGGFNDFMAKPIDPWEFCRRIHKLTGRDARDAEQQG